MELKNFISQTIAAIVEGVAEAQKHAQAHAAYVNPGNLTRGTGSVSSDAIWDNSNNNYARVVSFDVAVAVEENATTQARIGVVTGIFNLGAGGASENKERAMSRIKFDVPVLLPVMAAPGGARIGRRVGDVPP